MNALRSYFRNLSIKSGLPLLNIVAIIMLVVAIYGDPPYGFFLALKWVVVGACALNAWQLFNQIPGLIALAWLLIASAAVQALGSMDRSDWPPFNWASAILLSVSGCALLFLAETEKKSNNKGG
ncbi:MAG: hypothetical protein IH944_03630 [Armatimonadetes bacterium]|nr:hypothetical protein [Armatimonadota bacterium]